MRVALIVVNGKRATMRIAEYEYTLPPSVPSSPLLHAIACWYTLIWNDNRWPRFDYGEFRSVAELAFSSATYLTFGFVFDDAGTYVFASSCDPQAIFVLAVMPADVRWVGYWMNDATMSVFDAR